MIIGTWSFDSDVNGITASRSLGLAKIRLWRETDETDERLLKRAYSIAEKMEQAITESQALRELVEIVGPRMLRGQE